MIGLRQLLLLVAGRLLASRLAVELVLAIRTGGAHAASLDAGRGALRGGGPEGFTAAPPALRAFPQPPSPVY